MTNHCGYIALAGRPNVGKSTLINRLIGQKISITSRKPQTTRHSILGIHTIGSYQFLYVDTPGMHEQAKKTLNRVMNKTAKGILQDVDVIVFVVEALQWTEEDASVLKLIKQAKSPCFLAVNKIDRVGDKDRLLPWLKEISELYSFKALIPLSAKTGSQVQTLEQKLQDCLPEGPHLFGEDEVTDRSLRFLCSEWLREKIFRGFGQELPYTTAIEIEAYQEEENLIRIHALIWLEKENHKQIIIGEKGKKLKDISTQARLDMEKLLGKKVYLRCWCKVRSDWGDNKFMLKQLGYGS